MWGGFAVRVTKRQSRLATDFFSSEANEKLTSNNPGVQLCLAEKVTCLSLERGGTTGIWQSFIMSFEEVG